MILKKEQFKCYVLDQFYWFLSFVALAVVRSLTLLAHPAFPQVTLLQKSAVSL
jgi:hypothetical protein